MTQLTPPVSSRDHVSGNPGSLIELVEYGDYECPYCGAAYPIIKEIQQKLKSELKFVFRNFPLSKVHPHAFPAAVAAEAASLHGKFWEMHDIIFEHQKTLEPENMLGLVETIGLDVERFIIDVQKNDLIEKVENDFVSGMRSGVNKTPTFFINGNKYEGDWSDGQLLIYLESQLADTFQ